MIRQPGVALGDDAREQARRVILALLASAPLHKIGMRDAAREAGMGLATLYKYFGGKEALVHNVVAPEASALVDLVEQGSRHQIGVKSRFQAVLEAHFRFVRDHGDGARALWLNLPSSLWNDEADGWRAKRRDILTHVLKNGVHDGSVRDDIWPNDLAGSVLGAVDQHVENALRVGDSPDPRSTGTQLFQTLWPMVCA